MQHYIDLTQLLLSMTFPVALGRACSGSKILQGLYASNTSYPHDLNLQGPDSVPIVCHTRSFALKVSRCWLTCMLRICFCFLHVWRRWFAVAWAMYVCGCFLPVFGIDSDFHQATLAFCTMIWRRLRVIMFQKNSLTVEVCFV